MPRPRSRPFAFDLLAVLLGASIWPTTAPAQAPLPPPESVVPGAVVPTLTLPAPGQALPAPLVSPLPAAPAPATVPSTMLPGVVQPLPPPPTKPLFPGFTAPSSPSLDPYAPLPAGTVIGPGGPLVPGPPPAAHRSATTIRSTATAHRSPRSASRSATSHARSPIRHRTSAGSPSAAIRSSSRGAAIRLASAKGSNRRSNRFAARARCD